MTKKRVKDPTLDTDAEIDNEEVTDERTHLDKLSDLRRDIEGESAVTKLLDILIDNEGGNSAELAAEIAEAREANRSHVVGRDHDGEDAP